MSKGVYRYVNGLYVSQIFQERTVQSALSYKPRPRDVFIVTYPKCGTTWMQFIVFCIYNDGETPADLVDFFKRTPFLEMLGAKAAENMPRPGAIKTHLPYRLQPKSPDARYIYVARNPYDCCVSLYHHTRLFPIYEFEDGTFDEFFEMFFRGEVDFGDYFENLLSWYEHRDDDNVLFLTYEDLKRNPKEGILSVARFLGKEYEEKLLRDPRALEKVLNATSQESMKKFNAEFRKIESAMRNIQLENGDPKEEEDFSEHLKNLLAKPITGDFVRKGVVGDWRNHFSEEQIQRLKDAIGARPNALKVMSLWNDYDLP
ncbi:sulfotransferase ssu-1-like isoform X2 [Haemaphysalis longicornis]